MFLWRIKNETSSLTIAMTKLLWFFVVMSLKMTLVGLVDNIQKKELESLFQFHIVGFLIVGCSHSRVRNAIVLRPLFGTCTIYSKNCAKN